MADKQISDLTSASALTDGSLFVLEQAGAAKKANWGMMKNYISPGVAAQYSTSATYDVGDYVIYNGNLYRCITPITTAETWTAAHWTAAVIGNDVSDLKSAISKLDLKLDFTENHSIRTPSSGTVDPDGTYSSSYDSLIVPCKAGDSFSISVSSGSSARGWCLTDTNYGVLDRGAAETIITGVITATRNGYFIVNNKRAYSTAYVIKEIGKVEEYDKDIAQLKEDVNALEEPITTQRIGDNAVTPAKASFFEQTSHNLINPEDIDTGLFYSPSEDKIKTSSSSTANALTGMIAVSEGETYTFSGTAATQYGGYFGASAVAEAGQASISGVTLFDPVTGSGKCFTVPTGQSIKYVAFNLVKDTTTGLVSGTYQIEKGEMATPIVPYLLEYKIQEQYLPGSGGTSGIFTQVDVLPRPSYSFEKTKIQNFIAHHIAKDKDVVIVGTGTSLTARSSEHCTTRQDATSRPPLMHSNNFASKIWDRIAWDGQQYRRFDYPSFFAEIGSWSESANLSGWDDANYRYGITRYASAPASVSFVVPVDAWQFNFIYRSDTSGTENATVTISEGNGKMEVWNGSSWVEANGYTFSMRQSVVTLTNIEVRDPKTQSNMKTSVASYQVGGNTTYQKRLKMRCKSGTIDSRASTKNVTISASSGRLLYWGVEWSPREFMLTYINAARGSHNMTFDSSLSLSHFQDNEVWSFNPDLIFTENPIHNSGGSGDGGMSAYRTTYWGYATDDFFFKADNPISFVARATALGITGFEWVIFTSSLSWNFNGINEDGTLKIFQDKSGKMISALDAQEMCFQWVEDNETDVISINACKYWCDAGRKLFGDLKSATVGSGKNGTTFTNEGSHWNDTGCAVMDRCIGGVFDFYN